jgi:hypothetical protein
MKTQVEANVQINVCFTSALVGGEWSVSRPDCFTPGERASCIHLIKGSMGPKASFDAVEKITFLTSSKIKPRPLGRPASSQSVY